MNRRCIDLRRNRIAIVTMPDNGKVIKILPPPGAVKTRFFLEGDVKVAIRKQGDSTKSDKSTQN